MLLEVAIFPLVASSGYTVISNRCILIPILQQIGMNVVEMGSSQKVY